MPIPTRVSCSSKVFRRFRSLTQLSTATALSESQPVERPVCEGPVCEGPVCEGKAPALRPRRGRQCLAWALLAANGLALIATSAPPQYGITFVTDLEPVVVELSGEAPSARVRVRARALDLAPNGVTTTTAAAAFIEGNISAEGLGSAAPFVDVSVGQAAGGDAPSLVSALTQFGISSPLEFTGDCTGLEAEPCEAELVLNFRRQDGGDGGGTLRIELQIELSSHVSKGEDGPDEGPFDLPWDVEVLQ